METLKSQADGAPGNWNPAHILMYHDIEPRPLDPKYNHFYVLTTEFRRQMEALLNAGYQPVSLQEINASLSSGQALPKRSFAVTFDDGYRSFQQYAHPVLKELNIPCTVFLVSECVGRTNDWVSAEGYETTPLLGWEEIDALRSSWSGVDFQAHSATHKHLADIPISEAADELRRCKETLEERLQKTIDTICYPYGSVDDPVADAARELGYIAGVTTEFGRVRAADDPLRLPRISIHHVPTFSMKFGPRHANFWWRIKTRKDTRE